MDKNQKKIPFHRKYLGPLLVAPSTIVIFLVMLVPIVFALYMSLNKITFKGADTIYDFVWFGNYIDIVRSDPWFMQSLTTTILFTVLTVVAEIVLGIGIALVLHKQFVGRGFVRGLMILPWAMPTVVNAVMWKWILNADYGAMNGLLLNMGIISSDVSWLATPWGAFFSILLANIWKETPYVTLLALAALSTISDDIYEAASIDGTTGWKTFWQITLPLIKPVVLILIITKTIWAFQTFDLVAIMTGGGPENATNLLSFYIHRIAFKMNRFGSAAAMSYTLSMVCFVLTLLYIRLFMGKGEEVDAKKPARISRKERRAML